jgi:hypothetical protein
LESERVTLPLPPPPRLLVFSFPFAIDRCMWLWVPNAHTLSARAAHALLHTHTLRIGREGLGLRLLYMHGTSNDRLLIIIKTWEGPTFPCRRKKSLNEESAES